MHGVFLGDTTIFFFTCPTELGELGSGRAGWLGQGIRVGI